MKAYFGIFEDYDHMIREWGNIVHTPIPSKSEVLFASYGCEYYSGDALVLFEHDGTLYEVNGGHCSCYGLSEGNYSGSNESQWRPEETTWTALAMRKLDPDQHATEAREAFASLVAKHVKKETANAD